MARTRSITIKEILRRARVPTRRPLPVRPPIRPLPPKRYLPVPAKLKKPTKMYVGVTPPKKISKQPHKFVGGLKPSFKLKLPVKKKKKVKR